MKRNWFALLVVGISIMASAESADYDKSLNNLMVVRRESEGSLKTDEKLKPSGPAKATLPNGKVIEISPAWFEYIGDMHIRFVFDGPSSMQGLTTEEFASLRLTPEEAVNVAVKNIKRVYGRPTTTLWSGAVMVVSGESSDLDSSYFLDRAFWEQLLKQHPEGLVVGVPKRGGLIFVPASNTKEVDGLRTSIGMLHSTSERQRVSSALYLFKDGHWSIFQPPVAAK
jgi:hypothetical protein